MQMLFSPTLGFCMQQYFMFVQKPIHLGKSVDAWVADTLGEYKPIKGKGRKWPKYSWPRGCQWHLARVPSHPHVAPTLASALCNHKWQPACNPMSKTQTRHTKNANQRLPKRWRSPNRVDMATIAHVNRVTSNIYRHVSKLQWRRQSDCRF